MTQKPPEIQPQGPNLEALQNEQEVREQLRMTFFSEALALAINSQMCYDEDFMAMVDRTIRNIRRQIGVGVVHPRIPQAGVVEALRLYDASGPTQYLAPLMEVVALKLPEGYLQPIAYHLEQTLPTKGDLPGLFDTTPFQTILKYYKEQGADTPISDTVQEMASYAPVLSAAYLALRPNDQLGSIMLKAHSPQFALSQLAQSQFASSELQRLLGQIRSGTSLANLVFGINEEEGSEPARQAPPEELVQRERLETEAEARLRQALTREVQAECVLRQIKQREGALYKKIIDRFEQNVILGRGFYVLNGTQVEISNLQTFLRGRWRSDVERQTEILFDYYQKELAQTFFADPTLEEDIRLAMAGTIRHASADLDEDLPRIPLLSIARPSHEQYNEMPFYINQFLRRGGPQAEMLEGLFGSGTSAQEMRGQILVVLNKLQDRLESVPEPTPLRQVELERAEQQLGRIAILVEKARQTEEVASRARSLLTQILEALVQYNPALNTKQFEAIFSALSFGVAATLEPDPQYQKSRQFLNDPALPSNSLRYQSEQLNIGLRDREDWFKLTHSDVVSGRKLLEQVATGEVDLQKLVPALGFLFGNEGLNAEEFVAFLQQLCITTLQDSYGVDQPHPTRTD